MKTPYVFSIDTHQAAVKFLLDRLPGQYFTTYDLILVIRGTQTVDTNTPVQSSINASIGRGIKMVMEMFNLIEHQKKKRLTVSGRKTCCSVWRKL